VFFSPIIVNTFINHDESAEMEITFGTLGVVRGGKGGGGIKQ